MSADDPSGAASDDAQALAEACADALWRADNATQRLGMSIDRIAPGEATLSMLVVEAMTNGHGTCHGGYVFTLADSAFAFACNTVDQRSVAQHCAISYLRPARLGDRLTARAVEVVREGRSGLYDVTVSNDAGERVAEFRGHSRTIKGGILSSDS